MSDANKKFPQPPEPEEKCFHDYVEHLKRLQGGDFKKPALEDSKFNSKCTSGSELAAFLEIGAEAERRNEQQFQEMKCYIDELTKENENLKKENLTKTNTTVSLKKKIAENENVIMSLTSEIDQLNCQVLSNSRGDQNYSTQFECEKGQLIKENEILNCQLKNMKWKYIELKEKHNNCTSSNEVLDAKDDKIHRLTELLKEKDNHLRKITCELQDIKVKNCTFEQKVNSLEDQLQTQSEEFADKTSTYEKAIEDLESQVTFLEQSLSSKESDCSKDNGVYDEIVNQPMDLQESYIANQLSEQDRILQELIAKIELRDKNFQQLKNLRNSQFMLSDKEQCQLVKLIEAQADEIDQLTRQLHKIKGDDSESSELLQEVAELQNAVCDSAGEPQCIDLLSRRIKRIKCKIKSRVQREEAKRKELSRQLGLYRCQFVTLQKEIEELRHTNPNTAKDDIKIRVEKEKALSQVICHVNKQRRELHSKIAAMEKAWENIEKVNEFVVQMS
ncbi:putative leucine-rich repeat-containing protein DDB_G0290503 isoform X2 [Halyomorpha halys]|uniref:putative leucine-rich repeat-containing protein DDB_G0290503 isoform X2 n=1 Tax=Halyomorpha halys TaxID=286706 RepID=UPI0006D5131A|nr:synaptonemal complex protein 1-like isoform X2 [Halyomorpha halys]